MENRPSRPQRNRRHSRRAWPPEEDMHLPRPVKRLFTPEIKRMLKDWLIRRRDNPYPSRDEKKRLAIETGLTYTQICNWFANWRRKLKNSEHEQVKKSWGHLIKNYNTNARGNVEQFSISSEDSIWDEGANREDADYQTDDEDYFLTESDIDNRQENDKCSNVKPTTSYLQAPHTPKFYMEAVRVEHNNFYAGDSGYNTTAQCYQISSTTHDDTTTTYEIGDEEENLNVDRIDEVLPQQTQQQQKVQVQQLEPKTFSIANKTKYKHQIMEKYLRDTHETNCCQKKMATPPSNSCGAEFSKWLESAAKFRPNKNNYFIGWNRKRNKQEKRQRSQSVLVNALQTPTIQPIHQQQQLQKQPKPQQHQQLQQQPQPQQQNQRLQQQKPYHHIYDTIHHKDELDAAEALANLAFNCRQRMMDGHVLITTQQNNAIPST